MAARAKTLRDRLYASIGRFTVMWASMEMGIDLLAILASRANTPLREKTPHALADKINFIRRHLLPQMPNETASKIEHVLSKISALSKHRHDLIHGAAYSEEKDGETLLVTFGSLLQPRKKPRRPAIKFTAKQIDGLSKDVFDIWGELIDFAEAFAQSQGYRPT